MKIYLLLFYAINTHFLPPMKFFRKDILSKNLQLDALSSSGSPQDPLFIFLRYVSTKSFHIFVASVPVKCILFNTE